MHTSTLPAPARPAPAPPPAPGRHRTATPSRPRWERPALLALLAGTAVLYLWGLSASGYANEFYAAAVQAGTQPGRRGCSARSTPATRSPSTSRPPPLVMVAGRRLFGFNCWSLLVPQALRAWRRSRCCGRGPARAGPGAGLLAGAALALTPAAVLMFRFDNPDALLVLLLVAGAYATVRATDAASVRASTWWLVAAGAAVGFGFLTKMGQALLVVPAFGLAYLVAGPTPAAHPHPAAARRARRDGRRRRAGSWRWSSCGRPTRGPTSAGRRRTRCWSWRWATTASAVSSAGAATAAAVAAAAEQRLRRRRRDHPAVHRRAGTGDLLAAAGGADGAGRRLVAITWRAPRTRPAARPRPCSGRLDAGHRPGLQLHERHDAPVLHGRPRARRSRRSWASARRRCGRGGRRSWPAGRWR